MQSFRQYRQLGQQVKSLKGRSPSNNASPTIDGSEDQDDLTNSGATIQSTIPQDKDHMKDSGASPQSIGSQDRKSESIAVDWAGPSDPSNPRNWSRAYRNWIFLILWLNVFAVNWASPADSQAGKTIAQVFGVSEEAEALSPSLYTFGLATGSIFAGPIAETVGRNPVYVVSRCLNVVWLLGAALAPNFGAQCACRYLAGLCGSFLLSIHAASVADLYGPMQRMIAWPLIALASFWGTSLSPIAGAWIAQTSISWRWTEYVALILSGATLPLVVFFLPETFGPIILSWKARWLRYETGDDRYRCELDEQPTIWTRLAAALLRMVHMITKEPIVALLGFWLVIENIVVFGFLQGFTYIFGDTYSLERGYIGTSFAALALGAALWTATIPLYYHIYKKKVAQMQEEQYETRCDPLMVRSNYPGSDLPQPEYRLWSALLAAPAFPISLFWLGWTNYRSISYWSDLGSVVLLGFSWAGIYVTVYQYILDVYGIYAGSALTIIACGRYLVSGAANLLSRPVYDSIGVHWTATLLGCLALLLLPAPSVFYRYGPQIREKSAFAGHHKKMWS